MGKPLTSHTSPLSAEQAEKLRALLAERGYEFLEKDYAIYAARREGINVTVYEKGPKVLVQGKKTAEFVEFVLEPEILGEATLGYEEERFPERFEAHIGVDESGKGDFFGPLVVAGVFTSRDSARALLDAGAMDSKRITSDAKIRTLADAIRSIPGILWEVLVLRPEKYNELYGNFGNLNRLLAWGHATVIENLLEKRPDCPFALSDQFANPAVLKRAMKERGKRIDLRQRTRAESDPAVAAASILAREAFVDWLDGAGGNFGSTLPKGAGPQVKKAGRRLVRERGEDILESVAKLHFKTAAEILASPGKNGI